MAQTNWSNKFPADQQGVLQEAIVKPAGAEISPQIHTPQVGNATVPSQGHEHSVEKSVNDLGGVNRNHGQEVHSESDCESNESDTSSSREKRSSSCDSSLSGSCESSLSGNSKPEAIPRLIDKRSRIESSQLGSDCRNQCLEEHSGHEVRESRRHPRSPTSIKHSQDAAKQLTKSPNYVNKTHVNVRTSSNTSTKNRHRNYRNTCRTRVDDELEPINQDRRKIKKYLETDYHGNSFRREEHHSTDRRDDGYNRDMHSHDKKIKSIDKFLDNEKKRDRNFSACGNEKVRSAIEGINDRHQKAQENAGKSLLNTQRDDRLKRNCNHETVNYKLDKQSLGYSQNVQLKIHVSDKGRRIIKTGKDISLVSDDDLEASDDGDSKCGIDKRALDLSIDQSKKPPDGTEEILSDDELIGDESCSNLKIQARKLNPVLLQASSGHKSDNFSKKSDSGRSLNADSERHKMSSTFETHHSRHDYKLENDGENLFGDAYPYSGCYDKVHDIMIPNLCYDHNKNGCHVQHCGFLHVCRHFILGSCKFGEFCTKSHNLLKEQSFKLLKRVNPGFENKNITNGELVQLISEKIMKGRKSTKQNADSSTNVTTMNKGYNESDEELNVDPSFDARNYAFGTDLCVVVESKVNAFKKDSLKEIKSRHSNKAETKLFEDDKLVDRNETESKLFEDGKLIKRNEPGKKLGEDNKLIDKIKYETKLVKDKVDVDKKNTEKELHKDKQAMTIRSVKGKKPVDRNKLTRKLSACDKAATKICHIDKLVDKNETESKLFKDSKLVDRNKTGKKLCEDGNLIDNLKSETKLLEGKMGVDKKPMEEEIHTEKQAMKIRLVKDNKPVDRNKLKRKLSDFNKEETKLFECAKLMNKDEAESQLFKDGKLVERKETEKMLCKEKKLIDKIKSETKLLEDKVDTDRKNTEKELHENEPVTKAPRMFKDHKPVDIVKFRRKLSDSSKEETKLFENDYLVGKNKTESELFDNGKLVQRNQAEKQMCEDKKLLDKIKSEAKLLKDKMDMNKKNTEKEIHKDKPAMKTTLLEDKKTVDRNSPKTKLIDSNKETKLCEGDKLVGKNITESELFDDSKLVEKNQAGKQICEDKNLIATIKSETKLFEDNMDVDKKNTKKELLEDEPVIKATRLFKDRKPVDRNKLKRKLSDSNLAETKLFEDDNLVDKNETKSKLCVDGKLVDRNQAGKKLCEDKKLIDKIKSETKLLEDQMDVDKKQTDKELQKDKQSLKTRLLKDNNPVGRNKLKKILSDSNKEETILSEDDKLMDRNKLRRKLSDSNMAETKLFEDDNLIDKNETKSKLFGDDKLVSSKETHKKLCEEKKLIDKTKSETTLLEDKVDIDKKNTKKEVHDGKPAMKTTLFIEKKAVERNKTIDMKQRSLATDVKRKSLREDKDVRQNSTKGTFKKSKKNYNKEALSPVSVNEVDWNKYERYENISEGELSDKEVEGLDNQEDILLNNSNDFDSGTNIPLPLPTAENIAVPIGMNDPLVFNRPLGNNPQTYVGPMNRPPPNFSISTPSLYPVMQDNQPMMQVQKPLLPPASLHQIPPFRLPSDPCQAFFGIPNVGPQMFLGQQQIARPIFLGPVITGQPIIHTSLPILGQMVIQNHLQSSEFLHNLPNFPSQNFQSVQNSGPQINVLKNDNTPITIEVNAPQKKVTKPKKDNVDPELKETIKELGVKFPHKVPVNMSIIEFVTETELYKEEFASEILKVLVTMNLPYVTLKKLMALLKEKLSVYIKSEADMRKILEMFPSNFQIVETADSDDDDSDSESRKNVKIKAKVNLGFCEKHGFLPFAVGKCGCNALHICKFYFLSKCSNKHCKFGHKLKTDHNLAVLKHHKLHRLTGEEIINFMTDVDNRTRATIPAVCKYYSREKGCYKGDSTDYGTICHSLHICSYFVKGQCLNKECERSHCIRDQQPLSLLEKYGLDPDEIGDERLMQMLSEQAVNKKKGKDKDVPLEKSQNDVKSNEHKQQTEIQADKQSVGEIESVASNNVSQNCNTKVPAICRFYNNQGGCKRKDWGPDGKCHFLHVCYNFVIGVCKLTENCRRSHDLFTGPTAEILNNYNIDTSRLSAEEILCMLNKATGIEIAKKDS